MTGIAVLALGGTISAKPGPGGARAGHGADDLAGMIPETGAELRPRDLGTVSSRDIGPEQMWRLAGEIRAEIERGADGVVVTHGTDTLEETAYALAMLLDTPVPVVLTGAMRTPSMPGADGPANLWSAIRAAQVPAIAGYGPVVLHQDEIHLAALVTKHHSARVAAFTSPAAGPVGHVAEGTARLLVGPPAATPRLSSTAPPTAGVEIVYAAAGSGPLLMDTAAAALDGVVVAALGAGHLPAGLADAAKNAVRSGKPVVLASRCADGHVLRETYGGPGSERDLLAAGLLHSGGLTPAKARLRLLFGLSAGIAAAALFPSHEGTA